jgi:outer membrane autotransporter protein
MFSGELGAGYDFKADQLKWGPFLSGQYTSVGINAFNETGSALGLLSYGAQSEGSLDSDLGVMASRGWDLGGGTVLTPSLSAAWEHLYQGNLDALSASFGSGADFTVNGPALGTEAAVLSAGLNAQFGRGFNAFASYQGKVGETNVTEQNVSGGINLGF